MSQSHKLGSIHDSFDRFVPALPSPQLNLRVRVELRCKCNWALFKLIEPTRVPGMSESELGPARAFARDLFKSRIAILAGARVLSPELAPRSIEGSCSRVSRLQSKIQISGWVGGLK